MSLSVNAPTLNELYGQLHQLLRRAVRTCKTPSRDYSDFRAGDVRHSLAEIGKAQRLLGYAPAHRLAEGLRRTVAQYRKENYA